MRNEYPAKLYKYTRNLLELNETSHQNPLEHPESPQNKMIFMQEDHHNVDILNLYKSSDQDNLLQDIELSQQNETLELIYPELSQHKIIFCVTRPTQWNITTRAR